MLIVDVCDDPDDALRRGRAEVRIGPPHVAIERVAVRKHALRETLTDDHDRLVSAAILVGEIAAGHDRHAEHRKVIRRDDPQAGVRILLAVGGRVTFRRELHFRQNAGIPPWDHAADRCRFDAGQRAYASGRLFIEVEDCGAADAGCRRGHVEGQYVLHVDAGGCGLERNEGRQQHSGSGEENE